MTIRTYAELSRLSSFEDRYHYLELRGSVGRATFGFDRYVNQRFYTSREWKQTRHRVIDRDRGCDLGVEGFEIYSRILIHHINPITPEDITDRLESILDPDFLITTTHETHNAIHFGDASKLPRRVFDQRAPGDTRLW